jgi:zinc protease
VTRTTWPFPLNFKRLHHRLRAVAALLLATSLAPAAAAAPDKRPGTKSQAKKPGKTKAGQKKKAAAPAPAPASQAAKPAAPATPAAPPVVLALDVRRVTLENGLRVVINPDRTSPTVAIAVAYDVGSRNEEKGRSGFAHLFEHMMFEGSKNVKKGEHFTLIASHGGVMNGTTNADRTNYFEVLPSNELALGLWLEADRMKSLDVSAANFENQRKVVQEEFRMRYTNVPYRMSALRLEELVYQGYWPYEHSTIGSMKDLDDAKIEWVQEFHKRHYGPNNAVLAIAGDVDVDEALTLVKKYFDGVPKASIAPFEEGEKLREQTSQRTAVVRDDHARSPAVLYGWAIPPDRTPDHYAIEIAGMLLAGGESSRLHQLLVRDKALVQGVSAGTRDRRGPDLFSISTRLAAGAKSGDVEKLIEAEIKNLSARPPSDAEMAKARRQLEAGFVLGLQSNLTRATRLSEYELYFGDARLINGELARFLAVTKEDVRRVVAQYLGPTKRTIVETYPASAPEEAKAAPKPKAEAAPAPPAKPAKKGADKPKAAKAKKKK